MPEKKRILIIDDDLKSVKLERDLLEMAGYEVIAVGDAETGIAQAKELTPDLIIMDFQLPGMNGELAVKTLRVDVKTKDIPVVFVTASAMREERERLASLNVRVITKPINTRTFVKEIEEALYGQRKG
jgi:CheY-like chemotaxis protein